MRAVTVNFESRAVEVRHIAEPRRTRDDEVLFRINQVGVCGTDREIAAARLVLPPPGESSITIGHEALGQVVEIGPAVDRLKPGDWVVPIVRRPCVPTCEPCASGRMDLCASGKYTERGIARLDGYFTDFAIDESRYLLPIPAPLLDVAILIEPLSVVEKAIDLARQTHVEYFSSTPPRALVLGAGTIGILAAMALRERGFDVTVRSIEERNHERVRLLDFAGIRYTRDADWPADIVIEAAGAAEALVTGARSLARNGVMVTLGSPNATIAFPFRDLIIKSQSLIGSVNATPDSFRQSIDDLARFDGRVLRAMIHRVAFAAFEVTLQGPLCPHPKMVHVLE